MKQLNNIMIKIIINNYFISNLKTLVIQQHKLLLTYHWLTIVIIILIYTIYTI